MTIPTLDALLLTSLFGLGAAIHLVGPAFLRARYRRWRFPRSTYLVVGVLQLLAAVFLANPITRIWGVALAALITFVTIVNLLNHGKYAYSVPALLVLAALVPATLAGPL
jgi:uncharacterized membrane protein HdeD (DUF308 family)